MPEGYQVRGAVVRTVGGTHTVLELRSPDGAINILSSSDFPSFVEPSASLASQGIGEGGQVPGLLPGTSTPVLRHLPGADFVIHWLLPQRVGAGNFQVTATRDRSDLPFVQQINQHNTSSNAEMNAALGAGMAVDSRCDAGEVDYLISRGGVPLQGTALAITQRQAIASQDLLTGGMITSGSRSVHSVMLTEAPAERFAEASIHAAHVIGSVQFNPQWLAGEMHAQAQDATARNQAISETNEEIQRLMSDTMAERSASRDQMAEDVGRLLSGHEVVTDPTTGRRYEVQGGAGYYWLNPDGTYGRSENPGDFDPTATRQLLRP